MKKILTLSPFLRRLEPVYFTETDTLLPHGEPFPADTTLIYFLTSFAGCDSIVQLNVTVFTGTQDLNKHLEIALFPNPTDGLIYVRWDKQLFDIQQVEVMSAAGVRLRMVDFQAATGQLDLSELPPGMCILQFWTDKGVVMRRVVKT